MTDQENSGMRPDVQAERLQMAAEAFARIRKGNHWRDWRYLAQGFEIGRNHAMRVAYTNEPVGRGYNTAFSRWMDDPQHRAWTRGIDKATRNHLLWAADHLTLIEAWRDTLASNQRDRLNHPTIVKRAYEAAHRAEVARAAGEPAVLSPMAQIKEALVKSQEENDRLRRQVEKQGSLFDLFNDTPEMIARTVVESLKENRVERITKAIHDELKKRKEAREQERKKGLHAGE